MKLKTYAEMEQMYKDKFYTQWYGGLKDTVIDFIENNFIDIEGFNIDFSYSLLYKFSLLERIWFFKFLRLELWAMGLNLVKGEGANYRIFKKNKNDRYLNFLHYNGNNENSMFIFDEINYIQIITGKTYDEALKIFNAAINIKPQKENITKEKISKNIKSKKKKEENNNTAINIVNIATNITEEAKVSTDVTEALEQTLVSDDSE